MDYYGLWEPVLNRFLLCCYDAKLARLVKLLAAGRYTLYIYKINSAQNYQHNLIDNVCCDNWSVDAGSKPAIGDLPASMDVHSLYQLVPAPSQTDWPVQSEKDFLQICLYYVGFLEHFKSNIDQQAWYEIDRFMRSIYGDSFGTGYASLVETLESQIYRQLFSLKDNDMIWTRCQATVRASSLDIGLLLDRYGVSDV